MHNKIIQDDRENYIIKLFWDLKQKVEHGTTQLGKYQLYKYRIRAYYYTWAE